LDFGFWILDFGFWILDFGFWILDFGFWILDFGFWILDFGFWISPDGRIPLVHFSFQVLILRVARSLEPKNNPKSKIQNPKLANATANFSPKKPHLYSPESPDLERRSPIVSPSSNYRLDQVQCRHSCAPFSLPRPRLFQSR
jgi:hypothetical protein